MITLIAASLEMVSAILENQILRERKTAKLGMKRELQQELKMPRDLGFLTWSPNSVPVMIQMLVLKKLTKCLTNAIKYSLVGLTGNLKFTRT